MKVRVKNSGVVLLKRRGGVRRGFLYAAEATREIPFAIKRAYFITGADARAIRGNHAHKKLTQVIFCLQGSFTLLLDDGRCKQKIRMSDPSQGVVLGPYLWIAMGDFSKDCVIAVFADDYHREGDYIRDYDEFLKLAHAR